MLQQADLLIALLTRVRLEARFVCDTGRPQRWREGGADSANALFVYAAHGRVELADRGRVWVLEQGDLALLPHSVAERMGGVASDAELPAALLRGEAADAHGDTAPRVLCAGLHYDATSAMPLCRLFAPVMIAPAAAIAGEPMLSHALHGLSRELERAPALRNPVLLRALELIYALALELAVAGAVRAGEEQADTALRDPRIARCLYYMYTHFGEKCSLEELAAHAGLSKSALSARFNALVGEPPARHLARIRVAEARRLLRTTDLSQEAVAQQVGYASVVGMHLAFRAIAGETPGAARRREG
ncbi:helix-turn-helix domain-containing protein [Lysobacter enzymogenes]|uniref:helix-turn-helix domain-containing protein n=1 Tax=Lysobacter enzymogenes TaxID=69 RepID=UPI0009C650B2|nr:AraC family transcriptional regulator [Lysobacter enzymogenes]UZW59102.1 AraC family transcriptional regulator [Lysobacter enzymogenes]